MKIKRSQLARLVKEAMLQEQYEPRPPDLWNVIGVSDGDELLNKWVNIPANGRNERLYKITPSGVESPGGFAYVYAEVLAVHQDHVVGDGPDFIPGDYKDIPGDQSGGIEIDITSFKCIAAQPGDYQITCEYSYDIMGNSGDGTTTAPINWQEMKAMAIALKRGEQWGKYEPPGSHNQYIAMKICVTPGTPDWGAIAGEAPA
jgi:hypothetical protein